MVFLTCWVTAFGFKLGALVFKLQYTQLFLLNIPDATLPDRGFGKHAGDINLSLGRPMQRLLLHIDRILAVSRPA